jgi:hypothetical protein
MWPGLTTTLILKHFPNLDKMQKGHMKGQQKGVRSTNVRALVTIKVELGTENSPSPTIKKHYDIFVVVYKLLDHRPYGPNQRIPNYITKKLLVHHGGHSSGWE